MTSLIVLPATVAARENSFSRAPWHAGQTR